jgi:PAS domain S-box-containing protein
VRALEEERAIGLLAVDLRGAPTWVSPGFTALVGIDGADLCAATPVLGQWPQLEPVRRVVAEAIRGPNAPGPTRLTLVGRGGLRIAAQVSVRPIVEGGLRQGLLLTLTPLDPDPVSAPAHRPDVEEMRWTCLPGGALESFNTRFHAYLGFSPAEAGSVWVVAIHPDDLDGALTRWRQALNTTGPYDARFRLRRARDGAYRWHQAHAEPLHGADGRLVRWSGTCVEIHPDPDPQD